jgi:hypothetical protein
VPNWSDVQAHLRGRYKIAAEDDRGLDLYWELGAPPDRSLLQRTRVELRRAFGEPWLVIVGDVCAEAALEPREALRHNGKLSLGALALEGQGYVMRHGARLATLTWDDLERALEFVAVEASRVRLGKAADPAIFHAFAD